MPTAALIEADKNLNINSLINNKTFYHCYQPLFDLSNMSLYGYEAFFRCSMANNPELVFQTAMKKKKLYELDTVSISNAIWQYALSGREEILFVNLFPSTLLDPAFPGFLEQLVNRIGNLRGKLVWELNESQELEDLQAFANRTALLQQYGFRVALDDVGKGSGSLKTIIELSPDIIKLDRFFSQKLAVSQNKQKLIQLLVDYCGDAVTVILEGIEQQEDLDAAISLGVGIGQGYLLGKPDQLLTVCAN